MSAVASALPVPSSRATPGITLTTRTAGQSSLLPAPLLALLVSLHRAVEPGRQARLRARRVCITGPTDPKMVINALSSGARVFMADFEDSTSPTWRNLLAGQQALIGAVRGDLEYTAPPAADGRPGKRYSLRPYEEQ